MSKGDYGIGMLFAIIAVAQVYSTNSSYLQF